MRINEVENEWKIEYENRGIKRISSKNGIKKIEVWTTGKTGRNMLGGEAVGRWKVRGYKIDDKFFYNYNDAIKFQKT